ncbi:MAG: hypothetical protein COY40_06695 [Alphaproteobacteria bacterium CG_4_10_14_0_8_um_filter_53_9]|nr:MAG: hypothetical protein COY40_06695 [Alphaproteobacteria bacterium CG_4_10_14_0_8_um_filter_53_9]
MWRKNKYFYKSLFIKDVPYKAKDGQKRGWTGKNACEAGGFAASWPEIYKNTQRKNVDDKMEKKAGKI